MKNKLIETIDGFNEFTHIAPERCNQLPCEHCIMVINGGGCYLKYILELNLAILKKEVIPK